MISLPLPSRPGSPGPRWGRAYHALGALCILDIGLGTVAAGGGLGVPFAVGRLIFDRLGSSGHALFGGGSPGSGKRYFVSCKWFGKYPIDGVCPTAIVLNDFVGDMRHLRNSLAKNMRRGVNPALILWQ